MSVSAVSLRTGDSERSRMGITYGNNHLGRHPKVARQCGGIVMYVLL